jgi:hypothetical protein
MPTFSGAPARVSGAAATRWLPQIQMTTSVSASVPNAIARARPTRRSA